MRKWPIALFAALAACGAYPRDTAGTLDRIERTHEIRVGLASGTQDLAAAKIFVSRLERATGAKSRAKSEGIEALIAQLNAGDLDLVIGDVAIDSPWAADVAVIEPLTKRRVGRSTLGLSPIVRNGENRWIGFLERQARGSEK